MGASSRRAQQAGPGGRVPADGPDGAHPLPGRCQVRVLPPVPTEGLKPDDVPALADRVRHSMLTVFREISTDGRGGGDYLKKPGGVGEARL